MHMKCHADAFCSAKKDITFKSKTAQIAFKCLEEQAFVACVKERQAVDTHRSSARIRKTKVYNHPNNYDMEGVL